MYHHLKIFILLFAAAPAVWAQTDLARVEFTYFPQSDSDNSFRRFRTFINVPLKIREEGYLVPGFAYRNINLKLGDPLPFSASNKEHFQSLQFSLGYTDILKNNWRYVVQGNFTIASNFKRRLNSEDFVYGGTVFFVKDETKNPEMAAPWRLIVGASYSTIAGRPFPLPVLAYYREFMPDWAYTLGVPKTNIKYNITNKHEVQAFITLDGFYANIQEDVDVGAATPADTVSMTTLLSGLGYEYYFTKHLVAYLYAGYTVLNDIRLRDDGGDDVYTLNDSNSFYGRTGLKFKF